MGRRVAVMRVDVSVCGRERVAVSLTAAVSVCGAVSILREQLTSMRGVYVIQDEHETGLYLIREQIDCKSVYNDHDSKTRHLRHINHARRFAHHFALVHTNTSRFANGCSSEMIRRSTAQREVHYMIPVGF